MGSRDDPEMISQESHGFVGAEVTGMAVARDRIHAFGSVAHHVNARETGSLPRSAFDL